MRIKEVDKSIDLFYNNINETVAAAIGSVAMPIFTGPLKRNKSTKKKKSKKNA